MQRNTYICVLSCVRIGTPGTRRANEGMRGRVALTANANAFFSFVSVMDGGGEVPDLKKKTETKYLYSVRYEQSACG